MDHDHPWRWDCAGPPRYHRAMPPTTTSGASGVPGTPGDNSTSAVASGASALERALDRVGDRWSLLLIESLLGGELRFGELAGRVPGIAPNILTDRLRRLERAGVVIAEPYSTRPLRVAYRLTVDGQELAGVLRLLAAWGSTDDALAAGVVGGDGGQVGRHEACGTPVEVRWYCPTCARDLDDGEPSELRFV